jgi:hypothetical protein
MGPGPEGTGPGSRLAARNTVRSRDGREWRWKDEALLGERVDQGWFTAAEAKAITENARDVHDDLRQSGPWWDLGWAEWAPPDRR